MTSTTQTSSDLRQNPITWLTYVRSALFYVFFFTYTAVYGLFIAIVSLVLPFNLRYELARVWSRGVLCMAHIFCGVRFEVQGTENIPETPCVLMSKHQSGWETYFLQWFFAPQSTVLKAELLAIPVFGWVLRALEPIAIDRKMKRNALKEVVKQGADRLSKGRWVVIFPEGTRVLPTQKAVFGNSGSLLAAKNQAQVLPVALNSGECWPARSFLLTPGLITVAIGPVISTEDRSAKEVGIQTEAWMKEALLSISAIETRAANSQAD